jgi:hypothetical protein
MPTAAHQTTATAPRLPRSLGRPNGTRTAPDATRRDATRRDATRRDRGRLRPGARSGKLGGRGPRRLLSLYHEPALSPRLRRLVPPLLEVDVLVVLAAFGAAGIFANREGPAIGAALSWRALPALAAIAAFAGVRLREPRPGRLTYPAACAAVCALAALAHAPFGPHRLLEAPLALVTGALFGVIGLSVDGLEAYLEPPVAPASLDAGAGRKLVAAFCVVVFGVLPCAARGGLLLGLPTSLLGVAIAAGVAARDARRLALLARLALGLAGGYALREARPGDASLPALARAGRWRRSRTLVEAATGVPLARVARGASLWPLARLVAAAVVALMGLSLGATGAVMSLGLVKTPG